MLPLFLFHTETKREKINKSTKIDKNKSQYTAYAYSCLCMKNTEGKYHLKNKEIKQIKGVSRLEAISM